jgi:hypothetical protein
MIFRQNTENTERITMSTWIALIATPGESAAEIENLAKRAERAVQTYRAPSNVSRETFQRGWVLHSPRENGTTFERWGDASRGGIIPGVFVPRAAKALKPSHPNELDGFFALLSWNGEEVNVGTDIIGSAHVYTAACAVGTLVASSSALLAILVGAKIDEIALAEFISLGSVYGERSLFSGIRKIPAAQNWRFSGKSVSRETYWSVSSALPYRSSRESTARLAETTAEVIKKIGAKYGTIISDLTGGFDSRALFSVLCKNDLYPTLTVSGDPSEPDVFIAQRLRDHIGKAPLRVIARPNITLESFQNAAAMTDGEFDAWEFAAIAEIHRSHSKDFQVSINGSFGEVARGYWWELIWPGVEKTGAFPFHKVAQGRYANASAGQNVLKIEAQLALAPHFESLMRAQCADVADAPAATVMDNIYLRLRMQRWQGRIGSSTFQIWTALSPFGCREPLIAMLSAPPSQRIRSGMARDLISTLAPDLARIPLEQGSPAERLSLTNAHRFWPLAMHYGEKVRNKLAPRPAQPSTPNPAIALAVAKLGAAPHPAIEAVIENSQWAFAMQGSSVVTRRLLTVQQLLIQIDQVRDAISSANSP